MDSRSEKRLERPLKLILLLAVVAGIALRLYGVGWGLPAELHVDEGHFVPRAIRFGTGDFNPHFFLYPTLYTYVLFIAYVGYFVIGVISGVFQSATDFALQYFMDPSPFYLIGRTLSATLNMLTAWIVFATARRYFSTLTAFAATIIFLFMPLCVEHSHYVTSDVPLTFLVSLTLFFGLRLMETGERKYYLLSGLTLGFAMATKYTGVLIAPVLCVMHVARVMSTREAGSRLRNVFFCPDLYLMGVLSYVGFFIGCPYHLLDYKSFATAFGQIIETSHSYWLGNEDMRNVWLTIVRDFLPHAMGLPAFLLAGAGLIWSFAVKNRYGMALSFFIVFYYLYLGRSMHNFERYWLPVLPVASILAGEAIRAASARLFKKRSHVVAAIVVGALLVSAYNIPALNETTSNFALPFTQNIAGEWIEENIPSGTRVAIELHGPQIVANLESRVDAEIRSFEPGDVNVEAEAYNKIGSAAGDKNTRVSVTNKKYVKMALEREEKKYYVFGAFTLGSFTLDYYRRHNYEYLMVNSGMRGRYLAKPDHYPRTVAFYDSLDEQCELIKTFRPEKGKTTGPEIMIYRLAPAGGRESRPQR